MFHIYLLDHRLLSAFLKNCEALLNHSDTIMLKVKVKGAYLMMTDYEGFCLAEMRIMNKEKAPFIKMKGSKEETVKIMLDSLVQVLKNVTKNHHSAVLYSQVDKRLIVSEVSSDGKTVYGNFEVDSAEQRPRAFFVLSTRSFQRKCQGNYLKFRLVASEANRLITQLAIMSGINGGKLDLSFDPEPKTITFKIENDSGNYATVKIRSHAKSKTVPLQHCPQKPIQCRVLLTYLKRSQGFFQNQTEFLTFMLSNNGLIVQNEVNNHISTVVHLQDLTEEPLQSYT